MSYLTDFLRRAKRRLLRRSEGEQLLRQSYRKMHNKELDLDNAKLFTELLFRRLILINRSGDKRFTQLADKLGVREHVQKVIPGDHLVKLIWSGTDPRLIPFDRLPSRCVIKSNHGSGGHMIATPATDRQAVINHFSRALRENYYWVAREFHYFNIKPKVMIEDFIEDGFQDGPLDYRFWCFHGQPVLVQVDNSSHTINPFYTVDWKKTDLTYRKTHKDVDIPKPKNFDQMLDFARKLSADFDFIRVDMYNVHGQIIIGELTFTPVAGQFSLSPTHWDETLGRFWRGELLANPQSETP